MPLTSTRLSKTLVQAYSYHIGGDFISNTRIPYMLDKLQISSNKKASRQICISVLTDVRGLTHIQNNLIQTNFQEFLNISPFLLISVYL